MMTILGVRIRHILVALGLLFMAWLFIGCGATNPLAPTADGQLRRTVRTGDSTNPSTGTGTYQQHVDTLAYLLGDPGTWPRTGDQYQDQWIDRAGQRVCWTKYGRADMFECWRWDDVWVYHEVDHGLDGNLAGQSYHFTDGRWLPRYLDADTWAIDLPDNHQRWFLSTCQPDPSRSYRFPYRMAATLAAERLTLTYEPYNPAGDRTYPERFIFAKGQGWERWERDPYIVRFDQPGGPRVIPDLGTVCP